MHSKRSTPANYKSDETKEKRIKLDHKPLDFLENCENFVNFCEKKLYECMYGEAKCFNKFTSSSY